MFFLRVRLYNDNEKHQLPSLKQVQGQIFYKRSPIWTENGEDRIWAHLLTMLKIIHCVSLSVSGNVIICQLDMLKLAIPLNSSMEISR